MSKTATVYGRQGSGKSAQVGLVAQLAKEAGRSVGIITAVPDGMTSSKALYGTTVTDSARYHAHYDALKARLTRMIEAGEAARKAKTSTPDRVDVLVIDDLTVFFNQLMASKSSGDTTAWVALQNEWTSFTDILQRLNGLGTDVLITMHENPPKHVTAANSRDKTNAQNYLGGPATVGKQSMLLVGISSLTVRLRPVASALTDRLEGAVEDFPLGPLLAPHGGGFVFSCGDQADFTSRDRSHQFARVSPPVLAALMPDLHTGRPIPEPEAQVYTLAYQLKLHTGSSQAIEQFRAGLDPIVKGLSAPEVRRSVHLGVARAWADRPLTTADALGW